MAAKHRNSAEYSEAEARYAKQLMDPNVRVIRLTKGQVTIVDSSDYERLSQWNWHANWSCGKQGYYASRYVGKQRIYMQGEIMGLHQRRSAAKRHKLVVDHKNGDPCDNRRCNLQIISRSKDALKRKKQTNNTTGRRCITRRKRAHGYVYQAYISIRGKRRYLGTFKTFDSAVAARLKAIRRSCDPHQREYALNWSLLILVLLTVIHAAVSSLPEATHILTGVK